MTALPRVDTIPPGTFVDRVWTDTYTTSNGNTYKFSFEVQADTSFRVYIDQQPSYRGRDTDSHKIHRFTDEGDGRHYICWKTRLYTLEEAKQVAAGWARRTDFYIDNGIWKE